MRKSTLAKASSVAIGVVSLASLATLSVEVEGCSHSDSEKTATVSSALDGGGDAGTSTCMAPGPPTHPNQIAGDYVPATGGAIVAVPVGDGEDLTLLLDTTTPGSWCPAFSKTLTKTGTNAYTLKECFLPPVTYSSKGDNPCAGTMDGGAADGGPGFVATDDFYNGTYVATSDAGVLGAMASVAIVARDGTEMLFSGTSSPYKYLGESDLLSKLTGGLVPSGGGYIAVNEWGNTIDTVAAPTTGTTIPQYVTDADGLQTTITSAVVGGKVQVQNIQTPGTDGTPTLTTTFGYDSSYRLTTITFPNGDNTTYAYNSNNTLASISTKGSSGAVNFQSTFAYASPTSVTRTNWVNKSGTLVIDNAESYTLQATTCWILATTNPFSETTSVVYNDAGMVVDASDQTVIPNGWPTSYGYDNLMAFTGMTNPFGSMTVANDAGCRNPSTVTDNTSGVKTQLTYNAGGQVVTGVTVTGSAGTLGTTNTPLDSCGNPATAQLNGVTIATYTPTYATGCQVSALQIVDNEFNNTYKWTFDHYGHVTSYMKNSKTWQFTVSPGGVVTAVTYPDGSKIQVTAQMPDLSPKVWTTTDPNSNPLDKISLSNIVVAPNGGGSVAQSLQGGDAGITVYSVVNGQLVQTQLTTPGGTQLPATKIAITPTP